MWKMLRTTGLISDLEQKKYLALTDLDQTICWVCQKEWELEFDYSMELLWQEENKYKHLYNLQKKYIKKQDLGLKLNKLTSRNPTYIFYLPTKRTELYCVCLVCLSLYLFVLESLDKLPPHLVHKKTHYIRSTALKIAESLQDAGK